MPDKQQRMSAEEYRAMISPQSERAKDPLNQLRGRQSRESGKFFEMMIEAACEHYRLQKIAMIEKTPEPMKPLEHMGDGRFVAVYEKKAQVDFKGTLRGGRSFVFDAKHTDDTVIRQNAITDGQAAQLDIHHDLGAKCFVLVSIRAVDFFRIPWDNWRNMKAHYNRKYMSLLDLRPYRVPSGICQTQEGGKPGVLFLSDSKAEVNT